MLLLCLLLLCVCAIYAPASVCALVSVFALVCLRNCASVFMCVCVSVLLAGLKIEQAVLACRTLRCYAPLSPAQLCPGLLCPARARAVLLPAAHLTNTTPAASRLLRLLGAPVLLSAVGQLARIYGQKYIYKTGSKCGTRTN